VSFPVDHEARSPSAHGAVAPVTLLRRVTGPFRELLFLAEARDKVRARPAAVHASLRRYWLAARARLRVAEQLSPETEFAPVVALYREGIPPLVAASVIAAEGEVSASDVADIRAAWAALERVWPKLGIDVDLRDLRSAKEALCDPPPVDDPPPGKAEAAAACAAMSRLVALLERAIEPRTEKALAAYAATRQAVLGLAILIAIVVPLRAALAPRDLALHKPVMQSTVLAAREGVGGAYLVNGKLEYSYGAHTDNTGDGGKQDPWIMIDLLRPTRIGKIVVYNRGDTNFTDCLPLILEIGNDTSSMKALGTRKELFTRTEPWVVGRLDETARYVRVRMTGTAYIALDEIEVYAP
jgi:hypothetical protein